jgi:WD40 repeat protein
LPDGALARLGSLRWRHGEPITFVAAPPDGKTLITAGHDAVLRLCDRGTGKELRRFVPTEQLKAKGIVRTSIYMQGLTRAAMSKDGKLLAVALPGNVVQLWEVETGRALRQVKSPTNGVASMAFTPDGATLVIRGINDRAAYMHETETGKEIRKLKAEPANGKGGNIFGGAGDGTAVAISADGKTIALSELEFDGQKVSGSVTLFEIETGKAIRRIDSMTHGISAVAFSHDGKTLVFNSLNDIHVYSVETGKEIRKIRAVNGCQFMAFVPKEQVVAIKGRDQVVRLYNIDTGDLVRTLGERPAPKAGNVALFTNPNGAITTDVAFTADAKTLILGGQHLPRFFDVDTGKEQVIPDGGHRGAVTAIFASVDSKTVVSRGAEGALLVWDAAKSKELRQIPEPAGTSAVRFSADGKLVVFGNNDGSVQVVQVADAKQVHQFKSHQGSTAALAFSAEGERLASRGAYDGIVRIFDIAKGAELKQIAFHDVKSGDGRLIIRTSLGQRDSQPLALSANGKVVATYMASQQVLIQNRYTVHPDSNCLRLFDVATGKELRRIPMPEGRAIQQIAFSRDGRLLISENADKTVSMWEIASGQERARFGEPIAIAPVTSTTSFFVNAAARGPAMSPAGVTLAMSRDRALIAAPAGSDTINVYDATLGHVVGTFRGHDGAIASLEFTPDGKALVSGGNDSTLLVWDLARLKRAPRTPIAALPRQDLDRLWGDLINGNGLKAGQAIQMMIDGADGSVAFLKDRVQPTPEVDAKKVEKWIRDLESSKFQDRAIAAKELEKLGELGVPALQKALAADPSLEMRRRLQALLEEFTASELAPEQIRTVRAIEVLDKIGTAEARQTLERLARGAAGSLTTREAQATLGRAR